MISGGLLYFATIFMLGFVLGAMRTLWVMPMVGAAPALLLELPVMLLASWLLASRIVRRAHLSLAASAAMGALAFILLMTAEALLALFVFDQCVTSWIAGLMRMPGCIGLAGQVAFGLIPFVAALRFRSTDIRA